MEETITEQDLDNDSRQWLAGLDANSEAEPDLAIDGLSESLLGRLLRLITRR